MTGAFARSVDYSPAEAVEENKSSVRTLIHTEIIVLLQNIEGFVFGIEFKLVRERRDRDFLFVVILFFYVERYSVLNRFFVVLFVEGFDLDAVYRERVILCRRRSILHSVSVRRVKREQRSVC